MFESFAQYKNRYEKGQIFPFLIVIIVVMIILAMITMNLGQIGVFRTDVSNAADAGALAGASVLSGALLGYGLRSDMMTGDFIITVVAVIIFCCFVVTIPAAIATAIAFYIGGMINVWQSLGDGVMAWSNAKKTALQYAFQNAGITEPQPTFEQFLMHADIRGIYGLPDKIEDIPTNRLAELYEVYLKGDDPARSDEDRREIRHHSQTGFSRFMEHPLSGFAQPVGPIGPLSMSPARVVSGYGWELRDDDNRVYNSYDESRNYDLYHNWVAVEVIGSTMYPLESYTPVISELKEYVIKYIENNLKVPWWLEWAGIGWIIDHMIRPVVKLIIDVSLGAVGSLPVGLTMADEAGNTDNNPLMVTVRRSKGERDLVLWRFRYGTLKAMATARAFRDYPSDPARISIKPTLLGSLWDAIKSLIGGGNWDWTLFDTSRHLFETELTGVY